MTRITSSLKQDVGFPLHARLILHTCLVTAALTLLLVPYQITSPSGRSPEGDRDSVCVLCQWVTPGYLTLKRRGSLF